MKYVKKNLKIISFGLLILLGIGSVVFIQFFNRVPERIIPKGNVIVSPANGDVIHIEEVFDNELSFFKKDIENSLIIQGMHPPYTVVVIEMDLGNVHVQRAPIVGKVTYQEHFEGSHKNALTSENIEQLSRVNEKNFVVIKNEKISTGIIQVAGLAARRIQSFVDVGNNLEQGSVYGRILLGSQVVLIIPASAQLLTKVGDVLIDGETIIATYE